LSVGLWEAGLWDENYGHSLKGDRDKIGYNVVWEENAWEN
jgi:hypothetical protein